VVKSWLLAVGYWLLAIGLLSRQKNLCEALKKSSETSGARVLLLRARWYFRRPRAQRPARKPCAAPVMPVCS
jgi:hypothetical protein